MSSAAEQKGNEGFKGAKVESVRVTCTAPVNIAIIKYWGKRDETLILPINSSMSGTIDQGSMCSKTTITASLSAKEHTMSLNGERVDFNAKRLQTVFKALLARAEDLVGPLPEKRVLVKKEDWKLYKMNVDSANDFPTAAGLASSASGLACFTSCLARLLNFKEKFKGELSTIARQGSGSACRSLYGGFVTWKMGVKDDGVDSFAEQVVSQDHWPEMRVLIVVCGRGSKAIGSTPGMQGSVKTSALLEYRAEKVVPERMRLMKKALIEKQFETFAEVTMRDSNQFHAICMDTHPPLRYLNETSWRIISLVHEFNKKMGRECVAYTFDAGPHAVLYLLDDVMEDLLSHLLYYHLPQQHGLAEEKGFVSDRLKLITKEVEINGSDKLNGDIKPEDNGVSQIIVSKIGDGPRILQHVVVDEDGNELSLSV